jgi:hypothetical protein
MTWHVPYFSISLSSRINQDQRVTQQRLTFIWQTQQKIMNGLLVGLEYSESCWDDE